METEVRKKTGLNGRGTKEKLRRILVKYGITGSSPAVNEGSTVTAKNFVKGIGFAALSFLLSGARIYGFAAPFWTAFLCVTEKRLPWAVLGTLVYQILYAESAFLGIVVTAAILVMRFALCFFLRENKRDTLFREPIPFRMAISSAGGFVYGMARLFTVDFEKTALLSAVLYIGLSPLCLWIFSGITEKSRRYSGRYNIGLLCLALGMTLGFRGFETVGIMPEIIWVTLLSLCVGVRCGAMFGGVTGMICGLVCGIEYSPVFCIIGFISGAIRSSGVILPMLAACGSGIVMSFCISGFSSLGGVIPNIIWGAAVYTPIARFGLLPRLIPVGSVGDIPRELMTEAVAASVREKSEAERLNVLSDAMSSLSSVFYAMSEKLGKPDITEMRGICEQTLKSHCGECRMTGVCWGRDYERTSDALNKLAASTVTEGQSDSTYISGEFFGRCPQILNTVSEVNLVYARRLEAAAKENRTAVFAMDYEAMARLLKSAASVENEERKCDIYLTERLRSAAAEMGLGLDTAVVFGRRKKTIVCGGDVSGISRTSAEIMRGFGEALGFSLTSPEFSVNGCYTTFTMTTAPVMSCKWSQQTLKKEDETVSGDSTASFSCDDRFYSIISDGMGSGRDAAITSRVTVMFLQKMLSAGNRKNIVLEMLSDFIRHKNLECFTTVDLLEIDLLTGEASFVKSGAASSFILRDGKLFRIASSSLPLGITREITAEEIGFSLQCGDIVIMISDGISQSFEDGFWLADLLASGINASDDTDSIAELVLSEAKKNNLRADDMTVNVIKVGGGE